MTTILWDITPHRLADIYQNNRGTCSSFVAELTKMNTFTLNHLIIEVLYMANKLEVCIVFCVYCYVPF
jgi:hypothetical protein